MNIFRDLKNGDLIRRTGGDVSGIINGKVYTFDRYSLDNVKVKGHDGLFHADKFEFVARNSKIVVTSTFEHAKVGDKVFSLIYGEGEITHVDLDNEDYAINVKMKDKDGDETCQYFTVDGICKNDYHPLRTLFHSAPAIVAPDVEVVVECDILHRAEFIEAMKITAKEYIDGTHDWDGSKCALCNTMRKVLNVTNNSSENCKKVCPWVILTGKTCAQNKQGIERAVELLEWIQIYEKALEEGK